MEQFVHSAWSMIPFGLMLLTIAVAPLIAEHWWESNRHKLTVALFLGVPTAICLIVGGMLHDLEHQIFGDYIPFIILLLALYVITGGIHLSGDIKAKPWVNTTFLALGWVLASIMGTTGAAMLLIRPVLTTNQQREHKVHTVLFFIALCANCGGLLTPLGDPPLFMLFLRGAEFTWFASMWAPWLLTGGLLLAIYFALDTYYYNKQDYHHNNINQAQRKCRYRFVCITPCHHSLADGNKTSANPAANEPDQCNLNNLHHNIYRKIRRDIIEIIQCKVREICKLLGQSRCKRKE